MAQDTLTVALLTAVFPHDPDGAGLRATLRQAKEEGAELAVLPELPLNPWSPATRTPRDEDAEGPGGPRQQVMAAAAAEVGIALLGGVILQEEAGGERRSTALLYGAGGRELGRYQKVHLPQEEGFWEADHYRPGTEPPALVRGLPLDVGLQLCSDVNRPTGCQLLGAMGAELILAPRATPLDSYERWRLVLRADAVTAGAYLISTNRPGPEAGVGVGGPSIAIAPDGEVLLESTDPVAVVTLSRARVRQARLDYPGYLAFFPGLYAEGWRRVGAETAAT